MKKITILALHLNYGGVEKYISSLCKMLDQQYDIEIISTYKTKCAFSISDRIKIRYLIDDIPNKNEFLYNVKKFKFLKCFIIGLKSVNILWKRRIFNIKSIKNINSDYIITTRLFHNKLVNKYANKNIIKIATEHSYPSNRDVKKLIKSCSNFNYFICISKSIYELFKNDLSCIYIPNVLDNNPSSDSKLDNSNLVSIGRLESVKGYNDLIDIIDLVKKDIPDIKLNLIGDGSLKEEISNKIINLNLNKNIIMHGFLNSDEMDGILVNSSLYVMTSLSESFGLVLLESMSYKIPCIAFDSANGACELLKDNGILISNRNKEEMANKIVELLNNREELKSLGRISKEYASGYKIDLIKDEWIKLLEGDK